MKIHQLLFQHHTQTLAAFCLIAVGILFAQIVTAETIDQPMERNVVALKVQAKGPLLDRLDTASVGVKRSDMGVLVFCENVAPGETVSGNSRPILARDVEILLQAFSYSGPDCTGEESLGSDTLFRVMFPDPMPPESPVLLEPET